MCAIFFQSCDRICKDMFGECLTIEFTGTRNVRRAPHTVQYNAMSMVEFDDLNQYMSTTMFCLWDRTNNCGDLHFFLLDNVVFVKIAVLITLKELPSLFY